MKIGIIGGGPGGLMTAYLLQKHADTPFHATLFEAGPRLGGKVQTCRFSSMPATYEAGAAEFYDYSEVNDDPLKELVRELGLSTVPMGGSSVILNNRILSNMEDIEAHLGGAAAAALRVFSRTARDRMTPREFYTSDQPEITRNWSTDQRFDTLLNTVRDAGAQTYIRTLIHSDLATEPERTNIPYGLQNYLMNDPAYMRLYCIEGGNERMTEELARRIVADVRMESPVTSIGKGRDGLLRVTSTRDGRQTEDAFDFVIVALPKNHLPQLRFEGVHLAETMKRHHDRYDFPAHYLRITILFQRPFWRNRMSESFVMLDAFGGCCLYDESLRQPGADYGILGWLLGGDAAHDLHDLSNEELIRQALDSLPDFLADGKQFFVEGRVHRFIDAVNGMPGGLHPAPLDTRHQPEPLEHPHLFVVGDYLFDSTLNGVLDSAHYVSDWIGALMNERPSKVLTHA